MEILDGDKVLKKDVWIGLYEDKFTYKRGYNAIIGSNIYMTTAV